MFILFALFSVASAITLDEAFDTDIARWRLEHPITHKNAPDGGYLSPSEGMLRVESFDWTIQSFSARRSGDVVKKSNYVPNIIGDLLLANVTVNATYSAKAVLHWGCGPFDMSINATFPMALNVMAVVNTRAVDLRLVGSGVLPGTTAAVKSGHILGGKMYQEWLQKEAVNRAEPLVRQFARDVVSLLKLNATFAAVGN